MNTQTYSYFLDLQTRSDRVSVVKVAAGGREAMRRLLPFFGAYKYYKLGRVKLKFVPASTLPVDPTGLSLEAGEQTVDPRDQFNPGLVRITNGEYWGNPQDDSQVTNMDRYYQLMLDNRWYKFNLQSGFERHATPLYWGIGQIRQDIFPGMAQNYPGRQAIGESEVPQVISSKTFISKDVRGSVKTNLIWNSDSSGWGIFQVGERKELGWLPTDYTLNEELGNFPGDTGVNVPPEIELLTIILPKAYKTIYYYRVYVTETVHFKDPVAMNTVPMSDSTQLFNVGINGYDRFWNVLAPGQASYDVTPITSTQQYNDGDGYRFREGE